jgi:hypothetical protein
VLIVFIQIETVAKEFRSLDFHKRWSGVGPGRILLGMILAGPTFGTLFLLGLSVPWSIMFHPSLSLSLSLSFSLVLELFRPLPRHNDAAAGNVLIGEAVGKWVLIRAARRPPSLFTIRYSHTRLTHSRFTM